MRLRPLDFPHPEPGGRPPANGVRASSDGGTLLDLNDPALAQLMRSGFGTASGAVVNVETALKVAAAWRCLHIRAGICGNLPIDLYRRVSERERQPATGHPVRTILTERPNGWQTPAEFRKMLSAHAIMKGNGIGLKITARGRLLAIWPLNPDRVRARQAPDMSIAYDYTRADGSQTTLAQADVFHLRGLTWDGINGVGVLRYAREAMGLSMQVEQAGAQLFRQGIIGGKVFAKPGTLSEEAFFRLKQQLEEVRAGAENAHKVLILEDDLKSDGELMTAEDMQFLGLREFQRSDVAMFFGVPPHMAGIVDKTTSWGTGLEQQSTGFVQYTADDDFVMWEQTVARDLLDPVRDAGVYARINRNALMRGDVKTRWGAYVQALQNKVMNPNEVRGLEDLNPYDGGDEFLTPPNTAGTPAQEPADDATDRPPAP